MMIRRLIFAVMASLVIAACANAPATAVITIPAPHTAVALPTAPPPIAAAPNPATTPVAPLAVDTEYLTMQKAAQIMSCNADIITANDTYSFICIAADGHSTDVQLSRYAIPAEARAAFDAARGATATQCFHNYLAAEWQNDEQPADTAQPLRHRFYAWQAGTWYVKAHAFDIDGQPVTVSPAELSEAIYQSADYNGFLPAIEEGGGCQ